MWALFGRAFVDIEFHLRAALAKTLIRALHLLGQHICFSEHGRAPRWTLRDALASFAIGKMRGSHGPVISAFAFFQSCQGSGRLSLHQGLRRELHHRLRLGHLSCTLKSPTPSQRTGWSNIAFSHICALSSLSFRLEDDDGPVMDL